MRSGWGRLTAVFLSVLEADASGNFAEDAGFGEDDGAVGGAFCRGFAVGVLAAEMVAEDTVRDDRVAAGDAGPAVRELAEPEGWVAFGA